MGYFVDKCKKDREKILKQILFFALNLLFSCIVRKSIWKWVQFYKNLVSKKGKKFRNNSMRIWYKKLNNMKDRKSCLYIYINIMPLGN